MRRFIKQICFNLFGIKELLLIIKKETKYTIDIIYKQIEAYQSMLKFIDPCIPLPPMRGSVISPDFANLLISEIMENKPRVILECGGGVSTIISSYCLKRLGQGHVYSLDHEEKYANITKSNLKKHYVDDYATVTHAPIKNYELDGKVWPWYNLNTVDDIEKIDMLVIDGPPRTIDLEVRYPALVLLFNKLSDNAVIILDDAGRIGEKKIVKEWLDKYKGLHHEWYDLEKGAVILRKANLKECPCCKKQFYSYKPLPNKWRQPIEISDRQYFSQSFDEGSCYEQWECPFCKSNPRTRMYQIYLEEKINNYKKDISLLHIAPEKQLSDILCNSDRIHYTTMDLIRKDVDNNCDIRKMDIYEDQSFDVFICSHVLEHLPEGDQQALEELYRITKNGGWGILSVPILNDLNETYEEKYLNTDELRKRAYGDEKHYRMYSYSGLIQVAENAGFKTKKINGSEISFYGDINRQGITDDCSFFILERR